MVRRRVDSSSATLSRRFGLPLGVPKPPSVTTDEGKSLGSHGSVPLTSSARSSQRSPSVSAASGLVPSCSSSSSSKPSSSASRPMDRNVVSVALNAATQGKGAERWRTKNQHRRKREVMA